MEAFFCKQCGQKIPLATIKKRRPQNEYACSRECQVEWQKAHDFYKKISIIGKEARSKAVTISNQKNPRRKKATR